MSVDVSRRPPCAVRVPDGGGGLCSEDSDAWKCAAKALEIVNVARVDDVTAGGRRGDDDCIDEGCSGNRTKGLTNNLGQAEGQGFNIDRVENRLPDVGWSAPPLGDDVCGNRDD